MQLKVTKSSCYYSASIPFLPCFLHKNIEIYKCKSVIVTFVECGYNSWFLAQKEGYQGDKTEEIWMDEARSTSNSNEEHM